MLKQNSEAYIQLSNMVLKDEENIREMVAFPLGANGADAMMGCPGEVFEKQLRETHIKVRD